MVPTEKEHSVELPRELYGIKVEVLAFALQEEKHPVILPEIDPEVFYDGIRLDFSGYKFDRDEANER